jgi:hypothetical protein
MARLSSIFLAERGYVFTRNTGIGTGVCPKRKEPVRVDEAATFSSARTRQANGSSTFTPAFLKSRVFRVTTTKP